MAYNTVTSEYISSFVTFNPQYLYDLNVSSIVTSDSDVTNFTDKVVTDVSVVSDAMLNRTVSIKSVGVFESKLIIPLYVVIFLLAVVGNLLVVITLAQNKRMRTVTNVYLLNLAVSDLFLGMFCMPFTLVGQVLRNFIFGPAMCKLIPYIQAVSVSVGVWTLVAISLERYFAICRPLKSRRWQTQFHAYKMIALVWIASLLWNIPILAVSTLKAMRGRGHKCREEWPSAGSEQAYNLFLDGMLLLVPLVIMSLAYSLIVSKLWKGLQREIRQNNTCQNMERTYSSATMNGVTLIHPDQTNCSPDGSLPQHAVPGVLRKHRSTGGGRGGGQPHANGFGKRGETAYTTADGNPTKGAKSVKIWLLRGMMQVSLPNDGKARTGLAGGPLRASRDGLCQTTEPPVETTYTFTRHAIRSNYMDKSIEAKKNVIRMLFVIIAEFFICWAPLHVLNTVYLFSPQLLYNYVGSTGVALVQLLAYVSSCCNPITYCFMNKKFRQSFLAIFDCYRCSNGCCGGSGSRRCGEHGGAGRGATGRGGRTTPLNVSDVSANDSTLYLGRASTLCRSEVVVLEAEDRV